MCQFILLLSGRGGVEAQVTCSFLPQRSRDHIRGDVSRAGEVTGEPSMTDSQGRARSAFPKMGFEDPVGVCQAAREKK